jgi:hypothetical protein
MTDEQRDAGPGSFRDARLTDEDFSGAVFRSCDLRGARFIDCWLEDIDLSGLIGRLVVNDVDVTAFVESELDRRHPERAQLREVRTADDHRAMWDTIEALWAGTVERARHLPEPMRQERVADEWSFVETLRHLVFCTDAWVSRTVLDHERPYAPLGYPHSEYPRDDAIALGIDLDARPTLDEVLEVRADRQAVVRRIVDGVTDAGLLRLCSREPAPGYPLQPRTVGSASRW